MTKSSPHRIQSIAAIHQLAGLAQPEHPLISIIELKGQQNESGVQAVLFDFYVITLKRGCNKLIYGQQKYDFDEGLMAFMAPGQILRGEDGGMPENLDGWMLFIHPDFLWNTTLAKKLSNTNISTMPIMRLYSCLQKKKISSMALSIISN